MENNKTNFLTEIADYYSSKLVEYGETPQGVDWNGEEGQFLRFEQLCKILQGNNDKTNFSVNDLGCGYGALLNHLTTNHSVSSYVGVDVSEHMVQSARARNKEISNARFITATKPDVIADYGIASGIFNVRLGRNDAEWLDHLHATLDTLHETSKRGFAFNCLTSYSDENRKRNYLYYADPCILFDLCKRRYSRQVALLHDYGLYEFTILVRKI